MLDCAQVADRGEVRVGDDVLEAVHALHRDVGASKASTHWRCCVSALATNAQAVS
jgi:hypothetical protein